ncbi:MAG: hypothetical protein QOE96_1338 [Blastocatellia bacterium]|nr:hypothetical protein [Blastocatellia bacterium]
MSCRRTNVFGFSLVLFAIALPGCAKQNEEAKSVEPAPRVESTIEPAARVLALASPTPTPTRASTPSAPPNPTEIRDTVARVFEKAATPDVSRTPGFAVGDFNGDGAEDLAVAIKANEASLGDINNELANWSLEDPRNTPLPSLSNRVPPSKRAHVEKGDTLLAIIHGVGAQGWRATEAKQTYVLKNGAGSNLLAQSSEATRRASHKLPQLRGDVLNETIGGKAGFVFWTGAKYAWFSTSRE